MHCTIGNVTAWQCVQGMGTRNRQTHENISPSAKAKGNSSRRTLVCFPLTWNSSVAKAFQKEEDMVIVLDAETHDLGY